MPGSTVRASSSSCCTESLRDCSSLAMTRWYRPRQRPPPLGSGWYAGDAEEKETDYVMLADIFATGYHATQLAGVGPGDSVVIYGAGPVGLMAALSSMLKGASQVMVV